MESCFSKRQYGDFWTSQNSVESTRGHVQLKDGYFELGFDSRVKLASNTIHGALDSGEKVTLWAHDYPIYTPFEQSSEKLDQARMVSHVVLGDHCDSRENATFDKIVISFEHFKSWMRLDETIAESELYPVRQAVEIAAPFGIDATLNMRLLNRPVVERFADSTGEYPAFGRFVGDNAAIEISSACSLPYADWDMIEHSLARFVAFNYGIKLRTTRREYYAAHSGSKVELYMVSQMHPSVKRSHIHPMTLIITGGELAPEYALDKWLRALTDIYPVAQILAAQHFQRNAILESNVLSVIAALEKMHEYMGFRQSRFDTKAYKTIRRRLMELAEDDEHLNSTEVSSAELIDYLGQTVQNRKTMRSKMKELVESLGEHPFEALGFTSIEWINDVMKVRNNLAHTGAHDNASGSGGVVLLRRIKYQSLVVLTLLVRSWMGLPVPSKQRLIMMFPNPLS